MLDRSLVRYVTCPEEAGRRAAMLATEPVLGVDIETCPTAAYQGRPGAGLDPYLAEIRLVQVAALDGRVAIFDLHHIPLTVLAPLSAAPCWATFNGSFEWRHLTHAGMTVPRLNDGMLLDRLGSHQLRGLSAVSAEVLGVALDKTEQTGDWTAGELSAAQLDYAALDALVAVRIARTLLPRIERAGQLRLYRLWCAVLPVLSGLQLRGQAFDWAGHAALSARWQGERDALGQAVQEHLGPSVSPNSGPQLGAWLEGRLTADDLNRWPKTATGRLKTDADTLGLFSHLPLVQPLLRYKAVSKLLNTYAASYAKHRHPVTDKLHPEFSLGFTRSGRACAAKPNTQQAPKGAGFRELFIAPPGKVLLSADYSQIELVVAALLSGDAAMRDVYRRGGDLHRTTAAAIAGVAVDAVTPEQRQAAKPVNFGNLFGQGPAGLARTAFVDYGVSMSSAEAKQALMRFASAYPQLEQWKRQQVALAQQFRQVRTRLGLVRDFDVQGEGYLRGEAQNIPVQGSAAEVLMSALARLPAALAGLDAELYHTVHDEITLAVSPGDVDAATSALQGAMVGGFLDVFPEGADVVTTPEVKVGPSWAAVH